MRKLRLTAEEVREQTEKIIAMLTTGGATSGRIDFSLDLAKIEKPSEEKRAKVVFRPKAYLKMLELVNVFNSEVAWHFLVDRDTTDPTRFFITDVIVYPQEVTSATVEMDELQYGQWLMKIPDGDFNHIRGQGHSHVNMGCSASNTDMEHQEKIVGQLNEDSENPFYIFVITNKRREMRIWVYDIQENIVYENDDVSWYVYDADDDIVGFVNDAKELVVDKKTTYVTNVTKTTPNTTKKRSQTYVSDFEQDRYTRSMIYDRYF